MEIRRKPGGRAGRSSSSARWVPEVTLLTSSQSKDERDGLRLADMGEEILDDTYADLLLNSIPKEFEFIKQMHHRDRSFTLDQFKQTATNVLRCRAVEEFVGALRLWTWSSYGCHVQQRSMPSVQSLRALPVHLSWCREGTRSQTE